MESNSLYSGGSIAFVESLETFAEDLRIIRPTVFFSVPRLWTRFQQGVLEKLPQAKLERLLRLPCWAAWWPGASAEPSGWTVRGCW